MCVCLFDKILPLFTIVVFFLSSVLMLFEQLIGQKLSFFPNIIIKPDRFEITFNICPVIILDTLVKASRMDTQPITFN